MAERPREVLRSRSNPRVLEARRIAADPKLARREGVLLADGVTLVHEALAAGLEPRVIFIDPEAEDAYAVEAEARRRGARPLLANRSVLEAISSLATAQGAVGLFARPHHDGMHILAAPHADGPPLIAVFHGLQDPTNIGALIRTALAMGVHGAVCTEGTVDPFHARAVRGSMGACFRLPVAAVPAWEPLAAMLRKGMYRILALDPRGTTPLARVPRDRPLAIVLGREGTGLDPTARAECDFRVRIPMRGSTESLGVAAAGAIAFYELSGRGDTRDP